MKRTSTSKKPTRHREAKPRASTIQPPRSAVGASSAATSPRSHSLARPAAPRASAASTSMDAIKQDRITSIALYTLFGAIIVGMIYFIALVFVI